MLTADVINKQQPNITWVVRSFTDCPHKAKDYTQDIWLHILTVIHRFDKPLDSGFFTSWVKRIAYNYCINDYRYQNVLKRRRLAPVNIRYAYDQIVESVSDTLKTTETDINQSLQRCSDVIDKLQPVYYQDVIWLRLKDVNFRVISELVNLPLNTVLSAYHKGIRKVKTEITGVDHIVKKKKLKNEYIPKRIPRGMLNEQYIRNISLKYTTRVEFIKAHRSAYQAAKRLGILDSVCSHMKRKNNINNITRMANLKKSA